MAPRPPAAFLHPHLPQVLPTPALPHPGNRPSMSGATRQDQMPHTPAPPGRSNIRDEESASRQTDPQCPIKPWGQDESLRETRGLLWVGARRRVR